MRKSNPSPGNRGPTPHHPQRRAAFAIFALFCLSLSLGFVALGIDLGVISLTKTRMQNAVDAAALAAVQEITAALEGTSEAAPGETGEVGDANSIATSAASAMAVEVAALNGVYVDPGRDVEFGKRVFNKATNTFTINWGQTPFNVIRVTARRDNETPDQPDSMLSLFFAGIMGYDQAAITASATAYVEARDIVVVLDYSGSMNDDSTLAAIYRLDQNAVESNMQDIYNALGPPNMGNLPFWPDWPRIEGRDSNPKIHVTFKNTEVYVESTKNLSSVKLEFTNGRTQTLNASGRTGTFKGTGSNSGRAIRNCWVKSGNNGYNGEKFETGPDDIVRAFGLHNMTYPYPRGSWREFIEYCQGYAGASQIRNAGYEGKYGGLLWVQYLLEARFDFNDTPDLWKTPHYPFHAMKNGMSLFTEYLTELDFGDHLGLVTYDEQARIETQLNEAGIPDHVDLGSEWLTQDYAAINTIQRHKQAGHYGNYTGVGYGLEHAIDLIQEHGRDGARPTILLMTDGLANRSPNGWRLPSGWNWNDLTDYDGDGSADFTTSDRNMQYAFYEAKNAIDAGYTIHTLSVGAGADRNLMKAIAFAGGGTWIDVPGGSTVAAMEDQMRAAFAKIAAKVPPAKLLADPSDL